MAAKNKFRDKTDVIENAVIHVFGSILNISVPGTTNLGSLPLSIPTSFPRHVVLMHSKRPPLSRKHVRSIAIWRSAPQSVVTIKASWGKEPLQINFTLFHHPWIPSECRMVLGDGCRELGFGFRGSLPEKWTLRAKRWTTHVLTWRLTPGTLQCRFHLNKRQHRHQ